MRSSRLMMTTTVNGAAASCASCRSSRLTNKCRAWTKKIYYIALPRATVPSLDRVETGVVIRPRTGCRELVDALIITRYVGGDVANSAGTFFATCFAASSPRPAVFNNMFLMDIGRLLLRRLATDFDSLISTSIITKPPTPRSPRATATCRRETARRALGEASARRTAAIQTETTAAGARRGARARPATRARAAPATGPETLQ